MAQHDRPGCWLLVSYRRQNRRALNFQNIHALLDGPVGDGVAVLYRVTQLCFPIIPFLISFKLMSLFDVVQSYVTTNGHPSVMAYIDEHIGPPFHLRLQSTTNALQFGA